MEVDFSDVETWKGIATLMSCIAAWVALALSVRTSNIQKANLKLAQEKEDRQRPKLGLYSRSTSAEIRSAESVYNVVINITNKAEVANSVCRVSLILSYPVPGLKLNTIHLQPIPENIAIPLLIGPRASTDLKASFSVKSGLLRGVVPESTKIRVEDAEGRISELDIGF